MLVLYAIGTNVAMNSISPSDRIAAAKASVALILCLCSFATGLSPLKFANRWRSSSPSRVRISRKPTVSSLLLCFGGGVLLFTALVSMQPDVRRSVHVLQSAARLPDTDHLGDLIFCAGFFAVFFIDETLNMTRGRDRRPGSAAVAAVRPPRTPKSFRILFAVVALSFQEALIGLSFGMETVGPDNGVWCTYAAASANKLIVAFCLGMELAWSGARNSAIVASSAVFAAVTPVGVAVGMALSQCCSDAAADHSSQGVMHVISQGLAAGSLAFVVFLEVLPRNKHAGFKHLLSTIVGFFVMLLLQIASKYTITYTFTATCVHLDNIIVF